jgi:hypothetical protein
MAAAATIERMMPIQQRPLGAIFLATCVLTAPLASRAAEAARAPDGPGLSSPGRLRIFDMDAWQGPGYWRVGLSPFSHHFRYSAEHRYVWALAVERQSADDWLAGASFFRNSFGQPSGYFYVGKRFPALFDQPQLFGQLSAGVLYGYRGKFKNKVPLNVNGFAPGALISMGWQYDKHSSVTLHMLGDAGIMMQLAYDFH